MNVADLTQVGRTARDRAILEGERRFCGNKTDDILGDAVIMNKMERIAMLLDLRTAGGAHVDKDTYVKAKEELKETYIEYGLQCDKFDAQTEKDAEPKEPAVASKVITSSRTKPPTWTQGLHFAPGCAHDSDAEDDGALDDDDADDGLSTRRLELDKEFNKAWKHWKNKMAIVNWSTVSSTLLYSLLLTLYFIF